MIEAKNLHEPRKFYTNAVHDIFYAGSVKSIEIHNWFGFSISKFFPLLNYESKYISGENEITKGVELSREGSVTQLDTP